MPEQTKKALIVGAGPVGTLTALSLHKRGWKVEIWEGRPDPRETTEASALRSINLAISARGLTAIASVDAALRDELLDECIPMHGRMIHLAKSGNRDPQLYDARGGNHLNSLSRALLSIRMIRHLPSDIIARFNTKLSYIDWNSNTAHTSSKDPSKPSISTQFDLVIGCDGSWSKVRQEMARVERLNINQRYINHDYIELRMPPKKEADTTAQDKQVGQGEFLMETNYLHIWPRKEFMLIALPNKDGSFTLTLFCPRAIIAGLDSRAKASRFFQENFPDAVEWAGEDRLLSDFEDNPRGSLVSINCHPSHHIATRAKKGAAILLGDASHSMVPFYGQGLNCGLEDVRVLNYMLDKHGVRSDRSGESDAALNAALEEYSTSRAEDLEAIVELAMRNYTEMRDSVVSPFYHLRRVIDSIFSSVAKASPEKPIILPDVTVTDSPRPQTSSVLPTVASLPFPTPILNGWIALYHMVTFRPDVSYKEALRKERAQQKMVTTVVGLVTAGVGVLGLSGLVWAGTRAQQWLQRR